MHAVDACLHNLPICTCMHACALYALRQTCMHYACSCITYRLGLVTCPPAASMRFRSLGVFGLWSSVRRKAAPSLPTEGAETTERPVDGFRDIRNTSTVSVNPSHRLRGCLRNACLRREHKRARLVCMHCSKTMSSKPTARTDRRTDTKPLASRLHAL